MIFRWFDTTEVTQFAASVSREYVRLRKSSALRQDDAAKRSYKFAKLAASVSDFNLSRKPNFYKKARLIDEIRVGLRAQAIPESEIAAFVDSLLIAPIA